MFYLSSVSFHENDYKHVANISNYYIYVKDFHTSNSSKEASSFYDALQLCSNVIEEECWRSIVVNRLQSIEFHFRSYENKKQVISVMVHLPTFEVDIYSYGWQTYRSRYLRHNENYNIDDSVILDLLQRIYIKHNDTITYLSHSRPRAKKE
ncbi:hypothetical protein ACWE42_06820 [Sutcliffiella cohnii]